MAARSVCPRARPHLLTDYCGLEEPNAYNNILQAKLALMARSTTEFLILCVQPRIHL